MIRGGVVVVLFVNGIHAGWMARIPSSPSDMCSQFSLFCMALPWMALRLLMVLDRLVLCVSLEMVVGGDMLRGREVGLDGWLSLGSLWDLGL